MNLVWEHHIMWTRIILISIASDLKDLAATQTRLLQNPKDIANVFRKYYGNNAILFSIIFLHSRSILCC